MSLLPPVDDLGTNNKRPDHRPEPEVVDVDEKQIEVDGEAKWLYAAQNLSMKHTVNLIITDVKKIRDIDNGLLGLASHYLCNRGGWGCCR